MEVLPLHFAIMICTRDRPMCLAGALRALARLEVVAGSSLDIVVADNNPAPQEDFILRTAHDAGLHVRYVNEPTRGYSSIRNAAIRAALSTSADVFIFIDDDWRASPTLLKEFARAFAITGADVLQGNTDDHGRLRRQSADATTVRKAVGTYNVAFRRWLPDDAGVRFDPRLDLVGFEDREFFFACRKAGAVALYANEAVVHAPPAEELDRAAQRDLATFAEAAACNKIAIEKMLHGPLSALGVYLGSYAARGVVGVLGLSSAQLLSAVSHKLGRQLAEEADLMVRKHRGAWTGLRKGHGYDRAAARRGELIAVDLPDCD